MAKINMAIAPLLELGLGGDGGAAPFDLRQELARELPTGLRRARIVGVVLPRGEIILARKRRRPVRPERHPHKPEPWGRRQQIGARLDGEDLADAAQASADLRQQRVLQALGGHIRVESVPGHGASFTVELPPRAPEPLYAAASPEGSDAQA